MLPRWAKRRPLLKEIKLKGAIRCSVIGLLLWGAAVQAASAAAGSAQSLATGLALAQRQQCLGCHQVDRSRVGPPFVAIARRFRGQPDAAPYLARVIRGGSAGQWGAIPMPAQTRVSAADATRLAQWILSLAGR